MHVGVLICAYNADRFISDTLASVLSQTFSDWECLVIDNGSRDDTAGIASSFAARDARVRVMTAPHVGLQQSRNRALLAISATCEGIIFLDADDMWMPDALQVLHDELEAHPQFVAAHALAEYVDAHGAPLDPGGGPARGRLRMLLDKGRLRPSQGHEPTRFESLVFCSHISPPGLILIRRSAFLQVGMFDTSVILEDWDMYIRLIRLAPFAFVDRPVILYRRHRTSLTANEQRMREGTRQIYHRAFHDAANTAHQRDMMRVGWRAWCRYVMAEQGLVCVVAMREQRWEPAGRAFLRLFVHVFRWIRGAPGRGIV